jgi:hypothetical protein
MAGACRLDLPKEAKVDFSGINWLAVLACLVANMVSGFIWYSPKTLFPVWWKAMGRSDKDQPGMQSMGATWGLTILAALVQAVFLAVLVNGFGSMTGGATLASGVAIGCFVWLGFVVPTSLVNKLFAGISLKAWAIEVGNHLLNFAVMGAILGAWR